MSSIREVARRLSALIHRGRIDRDLEREMRFHLEMQAEENGDRGMGPDAAMLAARRQFGNATRLREAGRDVWGWSGLERAGQDLRHAARALWRDRSFTCVAILVLALGIGGNIAVFSLVNALLLNPFPYPHADRLIEIQSRPKGGAPHSTVPLPDYAYWRDQGTVYEAIGTYGWERSSLTAQSVPGFDGPERILTGVATHTFLRVLGVQPALGRFFTTDEDRPGAPPVVVLSYGAWRRRFGGSREVLGQTLTMDGTAHTIVGVMPAGLRLPGSFTCEVWKPAAYDIATNMQKGYNTRYDGNHVVARLKDGVSIARAQAELTAISGRIAAGHPERAVVWEAVAVPLGSDLAASQGQALRLLAAIVAAGLLLACTNLAGLLLARGAARAREMAVRASLGAGRGRLVRYLLNETLLLSLGGGLLGLGLAAWAIRIVGAFAPPPMGLDSALRIDPTVILFALGVSLLTGLAFGLVPALRGSKMDVAGVLKGTSDRGRARRGGRLLSALVVAEVSLALLLLAGGELMVKSLVRLARVDTGIRTDGVLTFRVSLAGARYNAEQDRGALFNALLERLRRLPGVTSAGGVNPLPMSGEFSGGYWRQILVQYCRATPGYFRTLGIPVLAGREFEDGDGAATPVVVVNRAFARGFFPGGNALGQRLPNAGRIVGVVGDVRHNGPARAPEAQVYFSFGQGGARSIWFTLRTPGNPLTLAPLVRRAVRDLDAELPIERLRPMRDVVSESMAEPRIVGTIIAGFAVFALALAAIGLYGVTAYSVSQRRHEFGIRMALGASRRTILAVVVRRGACLAALGIAAGAPIALGSGRLLASLLYDVSPRDVGVLVSVAVVLLGVALVASLLPAHHATRIDPLAALRSE